MQLVFFAAHARYGHSIFPPYNRLLTNFVNRKYRISTTRMSSSSKLGKICNDWSTNPKYLFRINTDVTLVHGHMPVLVATWRDDAQVAPVDESFERGLLLNNFATNNRSLFPLVARVTGWQEETPILERHLVRPGVEIVIHGWTRQSKVLATCGKQGYAIPVTYQGWCHARSRCRIDNVCIQFVVAFCV